MLTKERTSKFRAVKLAVVMLALVAVLAFCLTACSKAQPVSAEYVSGTLAKATYNQGETFDCSGAQIKITYDNDATETVNVTAAMVGEVVLNTVGSVSVNVTYSTEGGSVTAIIPVTVVDPYAADKDAAINAINANSFVTDNASDKGVTILLNEFTAEIKAATSKDAIDALTDAFADEVETYVNAKKNARATINNVSTSALVDQFLLRAESAKLKALDDVNAATDAANAEAVALTYVETITNLIKEQKVYIEDSNVSKPEDLENQLDSQIKLKIAILNKIDKYLIQIAERKALVIANGNPAKVDEFVAIYNKATDDLKFWDDYVTLAIDLGGIAEKVDLVAANALRTPIDDIYDAIRDMAYDKANGIYTEDVLADGEGIVIIPAPYVEDETNPGVYVLDTDTIGALKDKIDALYTSAVDQFGATLAEDMYTDHTVFGTDIKINLRDDYVQLLKDKHDELEQIQQDAEAVMDAIDAIASAADDAAKNTAIDDAWAALKAWGAANAIFSEDATIVFENNLVFDKKYAGVYTVTEGETTVDKAVADYDFTEDYMVTYFVPNYQVLIDATRAIDALELKKLVANIPEFIVYSHIDTIDSKNSIDVADAARTAYITEHGKEAYETYCFEDGVDVILDKITAATQEHTELVAQALELNNLIAALPDAADIVLSDYDGSEGALKLTYDAYKAFAERNDDENGVWHTDVIADVDGDAATTNDLNEAKLLACVDEYVRKKYIEERTVLAPLGIYATAKIRVDGIDENETALREAISNKAKELVTTLLTDAEYEYDASANTNFNRIDVLLDNIAEVETYVDAAEQAIADVTV